MVDQEQNRLVINPLKYLNNLPDFNGDNRDLQTFITLIDRVHPHLQTYDELSQLLFSDIIKSKLKGKARQTIEINCHAVSWAEIKNTLQNNFGDRRSCDELFDELRGVTFKTNTLEFYNDIKNKLHRLNNKLVVILGETEAARQSASNNMKTALNIFKSKIPEPMKTILFCRNPTDLEQAMDILFQAGYAYTENGNVQTRYNGNKPHIGHSVKPNHKHQQNHKKQESHRKYSGQPHHDQKPNFQPLYRQNRNYQPFYNQQAPNSQRQPKFYPSQPFHHQQAPPNNSYNQQPVEPMDINISENFRDIASGRNYHI